MTKLTKFELSNSADPLKKVKAGFAISFFVIVVLIFLSIYSVVILKVRARWVTHTDTVILNLENVLSGLKDAETGQRGYLLTENPEFLEPYISSYHKVFSNFNKLRRITIDNENQQRRLDSLIVLINKKYTSINNTIELQKAGKSDSAKLLVARAIGKRIMDDTRVLVRAMQKEEAGLRDVRYGKVASSFFITPILMLAASIMALIILGIFYFFMVKDIKRRLETEKELEVSNKRLLEVNEELKTAEEILKENNLDLEGMVIKRTHDLNVKNQELLLANADLDSFIYTASHDLKAPISNIEGIIHALKTTKAYEDEEGRELIEMINQSVDKFKKIISGLVEFTNVQDKPFVLREPILFNEILEDVKTDIGDLIKNLNVSIYADFTDSPEVFFSKNHLKSILYNLITNAIKFRHPDRDPEIKLKSICQDDFVLLKVIDNGQGIEKPNIDKIFTMFKKYHSNEEGIGLGLFLVKRIIENAEGKIEVESEVNKGTTFKIFFKNTKSEA